MKHVVFADIFIEYFILDDFMGKRRITLEQETSINETCVQEMNLDIVPSLEDTGEMPALPPDEFIDIDIEEEVHSEVSPSNAVNFNYQRFVQTTEVTQYIPLKKQIMEDDWKSFDLTTEIPADSIWMTSNNTPLPIVIDPTMTVTTVQPSRKDVRLKPGMTIHKGRRISVDDIVPMSGIDYDPMAGTTIIKVSNGDWVADAEYVLINYRILPSYFELQLETPK